jgi:flagella synthesis protein FlgN
MAIDPGFAQRLALLIQDERAGLQGFIALLQREEALLVATQIDALSALAEKKTALYRALQRLSDERVVMFARLGAKVSDENIRIVLADLPEALSAWQDVIAWPPRPRSATASTAS